MSSTMPSWSTARQSQCFLPAIVTTTSSRCHLSPALGSRRRIWFANACPNLSPSVDHSTGCASGTFGQLRPPAHRLVADYDAPRGKDLVHVAQAERKAEVEPDRVADDLCREAEAGVARANWRRHSIWLPDPIWPGKPVEHQVDDAPGGPGVRSHTGLKRRRSGRNWGPLVSGRPRPP